jgi:hypothetical protein
LCEDEKYLKEKQSAIIDFRDLGSEKRNQTLEIEGERGKFKDHSTFVRDSESTMTALSISVLKLGDILIQDGVKMALQ